MEAPQPQRREVELLDTNAPAGAFERFATAALRRRGVRIAGAVATALLVGAGAAAGLDQEEPTVVAQPEDAPTAAPRDPDSYEPPPWLTAREIGWAVLGRPEVDPESPVYVVTVRAVNRSLEPGRPQELRAVGRFEGRPGFRFSATCRGFNRDAAGVPRPVRSAVEPGERVLLRCTDTMEYAGNRPELDLRSIRIQGIQCGDEGRDPAYL